MAFCAGVLALLASVQRPGSVLRPGAGRVAISTASRRALVSTVPLGLAVALGGDLFGVTQAVLSIAPDASRTYRLDVLYPVGGFRRYLASDGAFEFVYPKAWLADQALSLPKAGQVRDPQVPFVPRAVAARRVGPQLDAAFGPPGGDRTKNVSVLRAALGKGKDVMAILGQPDRAAQRLLDSSIAPPGSGKEATLDAAQLRADGVLQFEYTVRFSEGTEMAGRVIRNVACVAYDAGTGDLFTLTVLAPREAWGAEGDVLRMIASSFRIARPDARRPAQL